MTEPSHPIDPIVGTALLRVQAPSKLAFGATTAALIALASGGTSLLVSRGTVSMSHVGSLPQGRLLPDVPPGTGALVVTAPAAPARAAAEQDTERALRQALAQRPAAPGSPRTRTLTAPLVALKPPARAAPAVPAAPLVPLVPLVPEVQGVQGVQLPPNPALVPPVVRPPVPLPPALTPPAVTPPPVTRPVVIPPEHLPRVPLPAVEPPVVEPPVAVPLDPSPAVEPVPAASGGCDGEDREDGKGRGHRGRSEASGPAVIDLREGVAGKVRARWAPAGRHAR